MGALSSEHVLYSMFYTLVCDIKKSMTKYSFWLKKEEFCGKINGKMSPPPANAPQLVNNDQPLLKDNNVL